MREVNEIVSIETLSRETESHDMIVSLGCSMYRLCTFESRAKSLESIASGYVWMVW